MFSSNNSQTSKEKIVMKIYTSSSFPEIGVYSDSHADYPMVTIELVLLL